MNPSIKTHGYKIVSANKLDGLDSLKIFIANYLRNKFQLVKDEPSNILNNIHSYANIKSDQMSNDLVLDVLKELSDKYDFSETIFEAFVSKSFEEDLISY